jgi:hypothetical protein
VGLTGSILLATFAVTAGLVGSIVSALVAAREHRGAAEAAFSPETTGFLRQFLTAPPIVALLLLITMFLPWVSGRVAGLPLPSTAWGLPWVRWIVFVPALLALVVCAPVTARRPVLLSVLCSTTFGVCVVLGALATVVAALATDAGHLTLVARTLLRGVPQAATYLPTLHAGAGPIIYTVLALTGIWSVPLLQHQRFRRANPTAADPWPSALAETSSLDPADDLWS